MLRALAAAVVLSLLAAPAHGQSASWVAQCQRLSAGLGIALIPDLSDPQKCKRDADSGQPGRSGNPNPNALQYDQFVEALYRYHGVSETVLVDGRQHTIITLSDSFLDGTLDQKLAAVRARIENQSSTHEQGIMMAPAAPQATPAPD